MDQHSKSAPKMRTSYTPRVKGTSKDNLIQNQVNAFFSDKKPTQQQNFINPESIENHIQKKLATETNVQPQQINNSSFSPVKIMVSQTQNPPEIKHATTKNRLGNNKGGRQIQWNNPNQIKPSYQQFRPQSGRIAQAQGSNSKERSQRPSSAHSINSTQSAHNQGSYPNRSEKSQLIKQRREQFDRKFDVAFEYLVKSNSAYLNQKKRVCNQKARPKEETVKIKRPGFNSSYKNFHQKYSNKFDQQIQPQNLKSSILLGSRKVCANSLNKQAHSGRQGPKAEKAKWDEGFKLQGPIYTATTSNNAYPNHGSYQKMVPIAVFNDHPRGMKHKQTSTSRRMLQGEYGSKPDMAKWHNMHPYGNDFFPDHSTHYKSVHGMKQIEPTQQWPHFDSKVHTAGGKFSTEYRSNNVNFTDHELNAQNHCSCDRKRH